ncbi:Kinase, CMGC RCK [Giardia muris]|uniref:Kinase, CMGC RCK n=1 Tax=Giardia muris TaxID=5742 RepID=A0A4Z1SLW9_GIAMU|nr:Kinase, CMGC RCK [Giardia muris]|eukprot:TNJ26666.1 Kinase, CMGC RCK [Giardia muris]
MESYTILTELGSGTYGTVYKARDNRSGRIVAVKHMRRKYKSWSECVTLKEVKSLLKMRAHANIVQLLEVLRQREDLYFVFEYINAGNLFDYISARRTAGQAIREDEARDLFRQILEGLSHIHSSNYMHRDLKCENVLVSENDGGRVAKIADLGCAKSLLERPPHTVYVGTRWYRAVELFLKDSSYTAKNDIWACACMLCEMLLMRPLFPGANDISMLNLITGTLGAPRREDWPAGYALADKMGYRFPNYTQPMSEKLRLLLPDVSDECISLLCGLFEYDPAKRLSAADALLHPWFSNRAPSTMLGRSTGPGGPGGCDGKLQLARDAVQRATQRLTDVPVEGISLTTSVGAGVKPPTAARTTKDLLQLTDDDGEMHDNQMLDMIDDLL